MSKSRKLIKKPSKYFVIFLFLYISGHDVGRFKNIWRGVGGVWRASVRGGQWESVWCHKGEKRIVKTVQISEQHSGCCKWSHLQVNFARLRTKDAATESSPHENISFEWFEYNIWPVTNIDPRHKKVFWIWSSALELGLLSWISKGGTTRCYV